MKRAQAAGFDGLLVTHLPDIRYLTGFTGSAGVLLLGNRRPVLLTDGRYRQQARQEAVGCQLEIVNKAALSATGEWMAAASPLRYGFNPTHLTVAGLESLRKALPAQKRKLLRPVKEDVVAAEREIKDPEELEILRKAASLGCSVFDAILAEADPAMSEAELALAIEYKARTAGADAMSFETIVAGGQRGALPHARPTRQLLPKAGFVTLDFGVVYQGYCSDMTRTISFGKLSAEQRAVYDSVLDAQISAVDRIAPGVCVADIDEAARSVLRKRRLDRYFSHSTGHGVGLEIHETPRIAAKQTQVLAPGMVITVEPGVYLPDQFGVRIEDMVLVTQTGHEILTPSPKALVEL